MTIALVVHGCRFGGDRRIATAVADGLSAWMPALAVPVERAPRQLGAETGLLVLGGQDTDLCEWLTELSTTVPGIPAAAWEGTSTVPREERLLRLRGFDLVAPVEHFTTDAEADRAREWGARLGRLVGSRVHA